jgi:hypothetical protein
MSISAHYSFPDGPASSSCSRSRRYRRVMVYRPDAVTAAEERGTEWEHSLAAEKHAQRE